MSFNWNAQYMVLKASTARLTHIIIMMIVNSFQTTWALTQEWLLPDAGHEGFVARAGFLQVVVRILSAEP